MRHILAKWLPFLLLVLMSCGSASNGEESPEFAVPEFIVPGFDREISALNRLHELHRPKAFTRCALWDAWLPMSTLWSSEKAPSYYRDSLLQRGIDAEGYVSIQQHRGMAHSEGWPFPAWQQSTGMGWHFSVAEEPWAVAHFKLKALTSTDGWQIEGAAVEEIDPARGLELRATNSLITITTPPFRCGTIVAPFVRIEWQAEGLDPLSRPRMGWLLEGQQQWSNERQAQFSQHAQSGRMAFTNVPLYRHTGYAGLVTRYRITIDRAEGCRLTLKSLITAVDTRHPITGAVYLSACCDYFDWTADCEFLRLNIGRMREALRFTLDEFSVWRQKHVVVPWVGHDGRSGLVVPAQGDKRLRPGLGVGNNYWDLLPFGGHDALATIYTFAAVNRMARLERQLRDHREWNISAEGAFSCDELKRLGGEMKADFARRFWDGKAERFVGWIDLEGRPYDYGFTFVNLEALCYGIASPRHAESIFSWLDGSRAIAGDTSTGADIYHWRFAPRATTRRNVETYVWPWARPESIPFGGQVQDGGAVLGFSYFDLMARLANRGPDDAWKRLQEILAWFIEVEREGGYRAYYAQPGRGSLQGGGQAGGLGLDAEFLESVLVPQVVLYGFLGCRPTAARLALDPRLPAAWPSLEVRRVRIRGYVLNIVAQRGGAISIHVERGGTAPLTVSAGSSTVRLLPGTDRATLPPAAGAPR